MQKKKYIVPELYLMKLSAADIIMESVDTGSFADLWDPSAPSTPDDTGSFKDLL